MSKSDRFPLTEKEKKRGMEEFVEGAARSSPKSDKKEKSVPLFIRIPKSLARDLSRLESLTGLKKNTFIVISLMDAAKEKLKEIERE